jgi:probable HAF family extracellular repeat protein
MTPSITVIAAGLVCTTMLASAEPRYTVTDLGSLGIESEAFDINTAGTTVGMSYITIQAHHAVRFDDPDPVQLLSPTGFGQTQAASINESGAVAALAFDVAGLGANTFLIDGAQVDLGPLIPRAIDAQCRIVGAQPFTAPGGAYLERAAWYDGATVLPLAPFQGSVSSIAQDINTAGHIVGSAIPAGAIRPRAVVWIADNPAELGTLGGSSAQALAVNDNGDIVGVADTSSGAPHAFLFETTNGVVTRRTDLGFLGGDSSAAYDINENRQAVGASHGRAFLWDDGVMHDLNDLLTNPAGWELQSAQAINDLGTIVGHGVHKPFGRRAFLLTLSQACLADLTGDGILDLADISAFITAFLAQDPAADLAPPSGVYDLADIQAFVAAFAAGCP